MKSLITMFVLVLAMTTLVNAQSEKTLVKSVALEGSDNVVLALNGEIASNEWDEDYVRIVTTIHVANFDDNILKRLVLVGRYNIESSMESGKLVVSMPKTTHFVTVKGVGLEEKLSFEVFIPKGVEVELPQKQTSTPSQSLF